MEVAFRSAGVKLSQPARWDSLPGIAEHRLSVGAIRLVSGNQLHDSVIIPGNDQIGLWASPVLELVLGLTDTSAPPQAAGLFALSK